MSSLLKRLVTRLPIPISKNHRYDIQTRRVLKKILRPDSNCIDVGCHEGEVLRSILRRAPRGRHFGFEPLPHLFERLQKKFPANCTFSPVALSNQKGEASFNYVISNPAYSGLIRRRYDKKHEKDTTLIVQTDRLDNLIPADLQVDFIKVDVEGGEYGVIEGAVETIKRCRPVVIFEHGRGGADMYGITPVMMYDLLAWRCRLKISLLSRYLKGEPYLTRAEFEEEFALEKNYYFIAYP
jgi:FkbM family methyltransferase